MATLEFYKRTQGLYTRIGTFAGFTGIGAIGSILLGNYLYATPGWNSQYIRVGVPTVLIIAIAAFMFWMVNRPKSADFLIATEGEMKKVSWSSRKEVSGSTKVVIVTTVILAMLILGVDLMFIGFFQWIGVMGS